MVDFKEVIERNPDAKEAGKKLNANTQGPLTQEQEWEKRKNTFSLSGGNFGFGAGGRRDLSKDLAVDLTVHTYPAATLGLEWKPLQGAIDTPIGPFGGKAGLYGGLAAASGLGFGPMVGVTGEVEHLQSHFILGANISCVPVSTSTFDSTPYTYGKGTYCVGTVRAGYRW